MSAKRVSLEGSSDNCLKPDLDRDDALGVPDS